MCNVTTTHQAGCYNKVCYYHGSHYIFSIIKLKRFMQPYDPCVSVTLHIKNNLITFSN